MRTDSHPDENLNFSHMETAWRDRLRRLQLEFDAEPDQRERNQILREMMELNQQSGLIEGHTPEP